jgi:hypothetical protein
VKDNWYRSEAAPSEIDIFEAVDSQVFFLNWLLIKDRHIKIIGLTAGPNNWLLYTNFIKKGISSAPNK